MRSMLIGMAGLALALGSTVGCSSDMREHHATSTAEASAQRAENAASRAEAAATRTEAAAQRTEAAMNSIDQRTTRSYRK